MEVAALVSTAFVSLTFLALGLSKVVGADRYLVASFHSSWPSFFKRRDFLRLLPLSECFVGLAIAAPLSGQFGSLLAVILSSSLFLFCLYEVTFGKFSGHLGSCGCAPLSRSASLTPLERLLSSGTLVCASLIALCAPTPAHGRLMVFLGVAAFGVLVVAKRRSEIRRGLRLLLGRVGRLAV